MPPVPLQWRTAGAEKNAPGDNIPPFPSATVPYESKLFKVECQRPKWQHLNTTHRPSVLTQPIVSSPC
jgi:hypothetical protein